MKLWGQAQVFRYFRSVGIALCLIIAAGCSSGSLNSSREEQLRKRIELAKSHFSNAKFESYVAMWSARMRPTFRESEEDWQKSVQKWKLFLSQEKPTSEILEVQIMGLRARAKMRVSTLEKNGSRGYDIVYDYWVFENGDWFLDDADRSE